MDAAVSPDCQTVAIVTLGQEGGSFQSQIQFYPVDQKEPSATVSLGNVVVLDLDYEDGLLWALGEDRVFAVTQEGTVAGMAVFRPTGTQHRVTDITPELLGTMHIRALVLDVDNTMATHGSQTPYEGVLEWTQRMTAAGLRLVVVSNNYKKRVAPFAAQFSLPYISFACKPSPFGYLRAKRLAGVRVRECLVVGDQIFTDILGAILCGMPSVLLDPIARDPAASVRFKRWLEHFLRPHYKRLDPTNYRKNGDSHALSD